MYYLPKISSNSIQSLFSHEKRLHPSHTTDFVPFLNERNSRGKLIKHSEPLSAKNQKSHRSRNKHRSLTINYKPPTLPSTNIFGDPLNQSIAEESFSSESQEIQQLTPGNVRSSNFNRNKLQNANKLFIQVRTTIVGSPENSPLIKKGIGKSKFFLRLPKIQNTNKEDECDEILKTETKVPFMKSLNRSVKSQIKLNLSTEEDSSYIQPKSPRKIPLCKIFFSFEFGFLNLN